MSEASAHLRATEAWLLVVGYRLEILKNHGWAGNTRPVLESLEAARNAFEAFQAAFLAELEP